MRWEIVDDPCPALDKGKYLCSGREGHAGDHVRDEWERGEIVGPIYWPNESVSR